MSKGRRHYSIKTGHYLIACLLLLSVSLRAIIPVGFMPSATGSTSFLPNLSFCITGLSTQAQQFFELPTAPHSHDEHISVDCVFASVLNKSALLDTGGAIVTWQAMLLWFTLLCAWRLIRPQQNDGPPLGARAPPVLPVSP